MNGSSPSTSVAPLVSSAPADDLKPAIDLHGQLVSESRTLQFDEFYTAHAGRIGAALEITLQNPELAEDALNEAMARALQRWKQVGGYANPSGWIYRVALNWASNWRRRRKRERRRAVHLVATDSVAHIEPGLATAMQNLSVEHRSVVVCRFHLDLSTAETADALGIAEGTVKSRLSRALDQLRSDLGVDEDER